MNRRIVAGIAGAALLGTVATSAAAYAELNKEVTVTVDGEARTVRTFASTVGDVLAAEKISVRPRDAVSPSVTADVRDGGEISVRYARPLTVEVDGKAVRHWTTARRVGSALDQMEIRLRDADLSVSRSAAIGRSGMDVEVLTAKRVLVEHDGRKTLVNGPVLDVNDVLDKAGVEVGSLDRVAPNPVAFVENGDRIRVQRVEIRRKTVSVELPYETVRRADDSMYDDQSERVREGRPGELERKVEAMYVDGERVRSRTLSKKVVSEPVDRVVTYGTAERPVSTGSVGGGVDSLNWDGLAQCESGGDPRAVNPSGYYGLYQFALSTWQSVGGSGNPIDASAEEQTYRAKLLYQRAGPGQWPYCSRYL